MTRVELEYDWTRPIGEADYEGLSRVGSIYGLMGFLMREDATGVVVEYDATRLTPDGVDRALQSLGLPVKRN